MNDLFTQFVQNVPQVWQRLGRTRQIVAVGGVAFIVVLAFVAFLASQRTDLRPVYSDLTEQDAAAIAASLEEARVPFELADQGTTIRVPAERVDDVRLLLASAGLPSGGAVGFEIFDRTQLGITDFAQRLNFQRGLEGELARTISRMTVVESARVHLVIPRESLFAERQRDPTASVQVKLRAGRQLQADQADTIKHLVASGVEGMTKENVVLTDVNGRLLGEEITDSNRLSLTRLETQMKQERDLENRLMRLLEGALGANRVLVKANLALDWDQVQRVSENFSPPGGVPQVRSQRDTREQFRGEAAVPPPPLGVPGTQANIPTYQAGVLAGPTDYNKSDVTTNFEVPRITETVQITPGAINKQSVAVMVDSNAPALSNVDVDQIQQVVIAAAGIDTTRGDQISVVSFPFDQGLASEQALLEEDQRRQMLINSLIGIAAVLLGIIGLFVIFRYLQRSLQPRDLPPAEATLEMATLPGGSAALPPGAAGLLPPTADELEARIEQEIQDRLDELLSEQEGNPEREEQLRLEREERQRSIREMIASMARERPEAMAEVLQGWMEENHRN